MRLDRLALCATVVVAVSACDGDGMTDWRAAAKATPDARDPSVARLWNEVLLEGIRNDFARPTVHARNLFHVSAAMYDAWAVYAERERTYLVGHEVHGFECPLSGFPRGRDIQLAREEAISYAAYRIIRHRFSESPGADYIRDLADTQMELLGFDPSVEATDYSDGSAAALGNYIAKCYIEYGLQDGSNEVNGYANTFYTPVNPPIDPSAPGNPDIEDLDRWQPISLPFFIDQAGNPIDFVPPNQSPEWGRVAPFALSEADLTIYERDGFEYYVYHDPGPPPTAHGPLSAEYKWTFALVAVWSSHLDQSDGVMIDISPASLGNIQEHEYPTSFEAARDFYDLFEGGALAHGYAVNPVTGAPYEPQIVPRGDYARALAEFWADGPDSETPPGHWFVILNTVSDHPQLEKRFEGAGPRLGPLEWDVKAYLALGGAMHDVAVTAWGIKGWYDFVRPISAIRAMADLGQSSDPALPSYHPDGIPLYEGFIELVEPGDPLAGAMGENVGKIKLYAWRGPSHVADPKVDQAGVGWILAENWWPYQRPTFVTPPFAGYISGHSTFSRAAAEVLTALTGSEYFPGGMSGFEIKANEFLVFEEGPSVDMTLQWARYQDAADQCSLSRIWGGIHPPADDIAGRLIGLEAGRDAFAYVKQLFTGG